MGNLFEALPDNLNEEVFEVLTRGETTTIERIVSKGHTSPKTGWYDQEQHEWVVVLKGEALLAFEHGESVCLTEGSYINIPAHTKHRVEWTNPNCETIWLAVHY
ncbi:MAG: cupin domain-containing protein [Elainellaceae cyanobacterium]